MTHQIGMTTAQLFVAVIEEGSIAAAARRENIAPSAISKRISELEQRLGHTLIRRTPAGIEITPTGELVLRRARNLVHEAKQLVADLAQLDAGIEGLVRIAAGESALLSHMPEILGDFMRAHRSIHVEMQERANVDVVLAVEQHEADLGIFTGSTPPGRLWIRPCFCDQVIAVMPRECALARYEAVTLVQLLDFEIVGCPERGALSALLDQHASNYGRKLRIRIRADGFELACRLANEGLGVAVVSESPSLLLAIEAMGLVARPLAEPWARRQHWVCAQPPETLSTAVRLMLSRVLRKQQHEDAVGVP